MMNEMKEFIAEAGKKADTNFRNLCESRGFEAKIKRSLEEAISLGVRKAYHHEQCQSTEATTMIRYLESIGCHNVKHYQNYSWHYFEFEF